MAQPATLQDGAGPAGWRAVLLPSDTLGKLPGRQSILHGQVKAKASETGVGQGNDSSATVT